MEMGLRTIRFYAFVIFTTFRGSKKLQLCKPISNSNIHGVSLRNYIFESSSFVEFNEFYRKLFSNKIKNVFLVDFE